MLAQGDATASQGWDLRATLDGGRGRAAPATAVLNERCVSRSLINFFSGFVARA